MIAILSVVLLNLALVLSARLLTLKMTNADSSHRLFMILYIVISVFCGSTVLRMAHITQLLYTLLLAPLYLVFIQIVVSRLVAVVLKFR